jgi:hypothetical protein
LEILFSLLSVLVSSERRTVSVLKEVESNCNLCREIVSLSSLSRIHNQRGNEKMKNVLTAFALSTSMALAVMGSPPTQAAKPGVSKTAQFQQQADRAAKAWLALVDSGKYGQSWTTAAPFFKKAITKSTWVETIGAVRSPLGAVQSRKLLSATYTTTLPNTPPGEYVVIQYSATFANHVVVETVTPMRGKNSAWHVSGYYVRPQ